MRGIVWCTTFLEGIEQIEKIEEQYKKLNIKVIEKNKSINHYSITFENKDVWRVILATNNARGYKCNISYISYQIPSSIIRDIIYPTTITFPYSAYHYYGEPLL